MSIITYKRCAETTDDAIFEAFQIGFSDYIVKIELTKEVFFRNFFGPEGNRPEHSVMAFDGDKPVGLILGGIKVYEGVKTIRCGALCVHPDYRGTGVSRRLFDLHREIALENDCGQMFLEVIVGNDRAINFYKKMGYEKVYDIVYFSHPDPSSITGALPGGVTIKRMDINGLRSLDSKVRDIHINWQNDFDYVSHISSQVHYGVYHDEKLVGGLSIHPAGKINFLWIDPDFRYHGIGRGLICHAVKELDPKRLAISFPNNAALSGFVKRLGFNKDPLSQYEMYLSL